METEIKMAFENWFYQVSDYFCMDWSPEAITRSMKSCYTSAVYVLKSFSLLNTTGYMCS